MQNRREGELRICSAKYTPQLGSTLHLMVCILPFSKTPAESMAMYNAEQVSQGENFIRSQAVLCEVRIWSEPCIEMDHIETGSFLPPLHTEDYIEVAPEHEAR